MNAPHATEKGMMNDPRDLKLFNEDHGDTRFWGKNYHPRIVKISFLKIKGVVLDFLDKDVILGKEYTPSITLQIRLHHRL